MMPQDLVRLLHGRGRSPRWRARCPVHRSRGLTLALKAGKERLSITCHAGCSSDDVLATLGLTWKDTLYCDTTLSPAEKKAWAKKKYIHDLYQREQRMQDLKMVMNALTKPRLKRCKTYFERAIEVAYR